MSITPMIQAVIAIMPELSCVLCVCCVAEEITGKITPVINPLERITTQITVMIHSPKPCSFSFSFSIHCMYYICIYMLCICV